MKKLYYKSPNLKAGFLLSFLFLSFNLCAQTTRYVKQGGTGNGSSWAQASGDIQAMINAAAWGDPIWVAAGTYSRTSGLSYSLKSGIKLYGGFPATGTPVIGDRNAAANITILKGNGNRVMLNADIDNNALMDGFTLQDGVLTGGDNGGAVLNSNSSPTISNCIFKNNSAVMWGGAIYNTGVDTHAKFVNCLFYGNSASGGGAIFDHNYSTPVYTNCTITGNTSSQNGGGIHTYENAVATLNNCIVWNNDALGGGDELYSIGSNTSVTANYSLIANDTNDISGSFNGTQTISSDPLFATGTYTLLQCSPAINAGNNAYITGTTTDLANNARFYSSGTVDIGAYEYQGAPGTSAAPTASAQVFCGSATVANLTATGTALKWYAASTGGTALSASTALSTTAYYVSQTVDGCESLRTSVSVTINPLPAAPTASAQAFCGTATVANLTASGTSLKWYNASTGGTALATSAALSTATYYVSQTNGNGCESTRISVSVSVNAIPSAPTASSQVFCGSATVANLTASGTLLQWYAASTGGTALTASTALTTTIYYVSQTVNGCESARTSVSVTVNPIPAAPTASSQAFCGSTTVANLIATGSSLQWYTASTGGTALITSTALSTTTYYVSQTVNGCESTRTSVSVTVNAIPVAPTASAQAFCGSATVANLTATGTSLQWYTASTGGTALITATALSTTTYYVSQTVNGCESTRTSVSVTVNAIPEAPTASAQVFCGTTTVANLTATGTSLKWYTGPAGGPALATNTSVTTGTRYVSQTVNGCESSRTAVSITVKPIPSAPVAATPQNIVFGGTVTDLAATGSSLQWYTAATGGNALAADATVTSGTYYVSQTVNGCESPRTTVAVALYSAIRYVKATASGTGEGTSWDNASADIQAMINAYNTEQVWVAAGIYKPSTFAGSGTTDREKAFVLKNNVKVYGGFAGSETTLAERDWNTNITILSGDLGVENDISDNAYHVVISLGAVGTAVLDGFSVRGGNANSSGFTNMGGNNYTPQVIGGGIFIFASSPTIANVAVTNNNATYVPAIDIQEHSSPVITNISVTGNTGTTNFGYAVSISSDSSPVITNATISGYTGSGLEINYNSSPILNNVVISGNTNNGLVTGYNCAPVLNNVTISGNNNLGMYTNSPGLILNNSIIYGNRYGTLDSVYTSYNSLVQENNGTANGNISGNTDPLFVNAPSYTTAPFNGGDYSLQACSRVIDKGNNDYIAGIATDLAGNPRLYNEDTADMGAYEYQGPALTHPDAPLATTQNFCGSATVANLTATGTSLQWYTAATGGTALAGTANVNTGTYYVSQTTNGCESGRTAVSITINTIPAAPVAATPQNITFDGTVAGLTATGSSLKWYNVASGGTALSSSAIVSDGTYYASQTVNGCESPRIAVVVSIYYPIRYVRYVASGTGDGTSWDNASADIQAMINAVGVQQIWVAAGIYKPAVLAGNGTNNRDKAFVLKNNVKVYGGFIGNETAFEQRNWTDHTTILSGDLGTENDISDNAYHVVISAGGVGTAELNGFTINGGNANGATGITVNGQNLTPYVGGGICNDHSSPAFNNLVISNNSATYGGGLNNNFSSSAFNNIAVSNNVSTDTGGGIYNVQSSPVLTNVTISGNTGNGMELGSVSSPILTNVTISGNTGDGIKTVNYSDTTFNNVVISGNGGHGINNEGYYSTSLAVKNATISGNAGYAIYSLYNGSIRVRNSILYGNGNGVSAGTVVSNNSLIQGLADTSNDNINGIMNPSFTYAPSYMSAPFTGGDYHLMACSPILNMGNNIYVSVSTDIGGNPRIYNNSTIDPGAYEYQGDPIVIAAPAAQTPQEFWIGNAPTVANLTATGTNLKWYRAETGSAALAGGTTLVEGKYYVSQSTGGCESPLSEVLVIINYPPIVYVKPVATGTGDGTSWANASGDLQSMINATGVQQVWVAAGTHKPTTKAGDGATDSNKAFVLKNNVKVYGGFTGNETALEQRDPVTNTSILSGDLGIENNASDNAYHIVISAGNVGTAVLDGFTIQKANCASNSPITVNNEYIDNTAGGGMYIASSSPGLANLTISNNTADYGGGIYSYSSSYVLSGVIISNNTAGTGSGIYNEYSSPVITNSSISGNSSEGIYNYESPQILTNVAISGNGGDGMHNDVSSATLTNVIISGNGDNGIYSYNCSLILNNVTIAGNGGYALYNDFNVNTIFKNTIVYGNQYSMYIPGNIPPTYYNSLVQEITDLPEGNFSGLTDPLFVNAPLYSTAPFTGGDYSLQACSPLLNSGNNDYVAGIATDAEGNPRIYNNGIVDLGAYEYQSIPAPGSPAPLASAQNFEPGVTVANLVATGTNIKWYDVAAAGIPLAGSTPLFSGTYYVSQTVDGCESPRTAVNIAVNYPATLYVKTTASGTGSGTSWANASGDLQAMINITGVQQVWVAAGQYQPAADQSFTMKTNVKIYGGFPTTGTPGMAGRNAKLYPTILAGNGNRVIDNNDNGLIGTAVLDGFIIQNGNASDNGGGMRNINSYPSVRNCIFRNNTAGNWGGAILNQGNGSVTITNCLFYGNQSTGGGANFDYQNAQTIYINVTFANNISTVNGGAIHTYDNASSKFYNCIFYGNTASQDGDQVISVGGGSIAAYNCSITNNAANINGPFTSNDPIAGTPLFTDASNGDYTLQPLSPGVDAGNTAYFANAATSADLSGTARLSAGSIDLGPYEYKELCAITTIWDGSAWSSGTPVSYEYSAVINGNYNTSEDGGITACSLTINDGDVIIADGDNFTIKGVVTVYDAIASLTVQHNANLIQVDDVENIGTITVIKESAPMYRLDYALWASPVAWQNLKGFSSQTLDNRFYTYNPLSDAYATVASPATTYMDEGKGYLIRVANNHPAYVSDDIAPTSWEGTFIGVPNNGNVDVPVTGMADGINGYNGVGNPYPSSINIKAFFEANQNNLAEDTPIYFWRKKNDAGTSSYCSLTLAGYNKNTGNAFGDSSNGVFDDPNDSENWVINPGQGFIVQATGSTVTFNNEMRVAVNNGQMFRSAMDASDKSRLWLNLSNTDGDFGQATIAYTPFTTLGRDFGWDGKALTDGDIAIYSLAGENKFGIQARPAFDPADEVPMEYKVTLAGNYTISLDHFDGVFAEGQEIYLRDNVLGVTHNLDSPYEFTTDAGIINGRFDVVYAEALDTDIPAFNSNSIIVYKQGSAINISTGNVDMKSVAVYDIRGRLLYSANNINAATASITTLQSQEQMLIVEITTVDSIKAGRKIIF